MKKLYILTLFLLLFPFLGNSQDNVVVLVDVSKSIKQSYFAQTKNVVKDIILGNPINNSNFSVSIDAKSPIIIGKKPLISSGKKLLIMPFGETYWMNASFKPTSISILPTDVETYINSKYPTRVSDNRTYLKLAKARAAQVAKSQGMDTYFLLLVSDNINDDYGGPNTKPVYNAAQRHLVENFATLSNPYLAPKHGEIDFVLDHNYKIRIFHVNLANWNYSPPASLIPSMKKDSIEYCKLKFISYTNGTRKKPKEVKNNQITFRWTASNSVEGTKYNFSIKSTDGNKQNNITKKTSSNSFSTELPNGTYRISVSVPGGACFSDTTYIEIDGGGSGSGFWILFLLVALVAAGFWLYKRNERNKTEELSNSRGGEDKIESSTDNNLNQESPTQSAGNFNF